jgi:D-tyrosyl-tRNA(Tyr) deacylase
MISVIQRVQKASVTIENKVYSSITNGLLVLLGIHQNDTIEEVDWMAEKIVKLRIFEDEDGKMNRSVIDCSGSILLVSQFTLLGDLKKGTRPSFTNAAKPETAIPLYESMIQKIMDYDVTTQTGVFGADMKVELINDGPVTIILER